MFKHTMKRLGTVKRSTAVLMVIMLLATTTVVAYAITTLFFKGESQTSDYSKKTYFEITSSEFFTASGEIGLGESMSINPVITSDAIENMYVFIRVEMPAYTDTGLYSMNINDGWSVEEYGVEGEQYIAVYRYDKVLEPGESTSPLSNSLAMVDMSVADYAALDNINVTMTGYACGADDMDMESAWDAIKSNYGL